MKVLLTGATGFVGGHLTRELIAKGHSVVPLIRPGSEKQLPGKDDKITPVYGDILKPETFRKALGECDAVIHLIGIRREFPQRGITYQKLHIEATRNIVQIAEESGIRRYVHMSALGTSPDSASGYFRSKATAEELVRNSSLEYTIFSPSIIFGPGDEFINYFADVISTFHVIPIVGLGTYRMQPVYIKDLCQIFEQSLTAKNTINECFDIAGPDRFEYREMMQVVKDVAEIKALPVYAPKFLMQGMAKLFQYYKFFPITEDQIVMLYAENITDDHRIFENLGIRQTGFKEGLQMYLTQ